MNPVDIVSTLQALQMLKYWKGKHLVLKRQVKFLLSSYTLLYICLRPSKVEPSQLKGNVPFLKSLNSCSFSPVSWLGLSSIVPLSEVSGKLLSHTWMTEASTTPVKQLYVALLYLCPLMIFLHQRRDPICGGESP